MLYIYAIADKGYTKMIHIFRRAIAPFLQEIIGVPMAS